jgi:hypothetical protein
VSADIAIPGEDSMATKNNRIIFFPFKTTLNIFHNLILTFKLKKIETLARYDLGFLNF